MPISSPGSIRGFFWLLDSIRLVSSKAAGLENWTVGLENKGRKLRQKGASPVLCRRDVCNPAAGVKPHSLSLELAFNMSSTRVDSNIQVNSS